MLLPALFFSMSSDRIHDWMLEHPYFGPIIRGRDHGLTMRMKWLAGTAITLSATLLTDNAVIRVILARVWGSAIWFVSRPTRASATT